MIALARPVHVFGYGRASTSKQVLTLEAQAQICREHYETLAKLGKFGPNHVWGGFLCDPATSAVKTDWFARPYGYALLLQAQPGDHIIVTKLDRCFRSIKDALQSREILMEKGVRLTIIATPIEFDTPLGELLFTMLAAFAKFEREMIRERMRDVSAHIAAQGRQPHHKDPPYGWKFGKNRILIPDMRVRHWGWHIVRLRQPDLTFTQVWKILRRSKKSYNGKEWNIDCMKMLYYAALINFAVTKGMPPQHVSVPDFMRPILAAERRRVLPALRGRAGRVKTSRAGIRMGDWERIVLEMEKDTILSASPRVSQQSARPTP